MPLANVPGDHAGEISVAARVSKTERVIAAGYERCSCIAADACPCELKSGLNILLAHHVINR